MISDVFSTARAELDVRLVLELDRLDESTDFCTWEERQYTRTLLFQRPSALPIAGFDGIVRDAELARQSTL